MKKGSFLLHVAKLYFHVHIHLVLVLIQVQWIVVVIFHYNNWYIIVRNFERDDEKSNEKFERNKIPVIFKDFKAIYIEYTDNKWTSIETI